MTKAREVTNLYLFVRYKLEASQRLSSTTFNTYSSAWVLAHQLTPVIIPQKELACVQ